MTRTRQPRRAFARRPIAIGLAAVHLVAALGLPAPALPAASAGGRPFPCHGKACGCSTAAQSLGAGCCCSTPAQKRAWLAAAGLEPSYTPHADRDCCKPVGGKHRSCCTPHKPHPFDGDRSVAWETAACHGDGPAGVISHPPTVAPFEPVAVRRQLPQDRVSEPVPSPVAVPVRPPVPPPKSV